MRVLTVCFLSEEWLPEALKLDQLCFGGLWNETGYHREIESPNSDLVILKSSPTIKSQTIPQLCQGIRHSQTETEQTFREAKKGTEPQEEHQLQMVLGISCSWAIVDEAHITLLGVHPAIRRQGFGMLMLWIQLYLARQRGMNRATLEVRLSNRGAIALYQSFGFKQAGIRKGYYQDTGEDALILWRGGLQSENFQAELKEWRNHVDQRLGRFGWMIDLQLVSSLQTQ